MLNQWPLLLNHWPYVRTKNPETINEEIWWNKQLVIPESEVEKAVNCENKLWKFYWSFFQSPVSLQSGRKKRRTNQRTKWKRTHNQRLTLKARFRKSLMISDLFARSWSYPPSAIGICFRCSTRSSSTSTCLRLQQHCWVWVSRWEPVFVIICKIPQKWSGWKIHRLKRFRSEPVFILCMNAVWRRLGSTARCQTIADRRVPLDQTNFDREFACNRPTPEGHKEVLLRCIIARIDHSITLVPKCLYIPRSTMSPRRMLWSPWSMRSTTECWRDLFTANGAAVARTNQVLDRRNGGGRKFGDWNSPPILRSITLYEQFEG